MTVVHGWRRWPWLRWLVPGALAVYLLILNPAGGAARVPYTLSVLGLPVAMLLGWVMAESPPLRARSIGRLRVAPVVVVLLSIAGAALAVEVARGMGLPAIRLAEAGLVAGASTAVGGFIGWRLDRLPKPTDLVIVLTLSTALFMNLYITSSGGQRDFGIYLRAGREFLAGRPVYSDTPLTAVPSDPTLDPFVYPPPVLPFFALLAALPDRVAHVAWIGLTLFTTVVSLRCFGVRWRWLPVLMFWPPIVQGIWVGNADMVVLAFFAAAPWVPTLLALPPFVKPQLGLTALWLVRDRRFGSLAIAAGIGTGLVLGTLPLVGIESWVAWIRALGTMTETVRNIPPLAGIALPRYLASPVPLVLALAAIVAAFRWAGRDGLADLGLASLVASPTLYPHGFVIGLPGLLRFGTLAFWCALAVTSSFYHPQAWWVVVLAAFVAPYVAWLTERRPAEGPHPVDEAGVWGDAPDVATSRRRGPVPVEP